MVHRQLISLGCWG